MLIFCKPWPSDYHRPVISFVWAFPAEKLQEFVEKSTKYSPDAYSKVDIWRENWQILTKSPAYFQPKTGD